MISFIALNFQTPSLFYQIDFLFLLNFNHIFRLTNLGQIYLFISYSIIIQNLILIIFNPCFHFITLLNKVNIFIILSLMISFYFSHQYAGFLNLKSECFDFLNHLLGLYYKISIFNILFLFNLVFLIHFLNVPVRF